MKLLVIYVPEVFFFLQKKNSRKQSVFEDVVNTELLLLGSLC